MDYTTNNSSNEQNIDQEQNQVACLIDNHNNDFLTMVCIDSDCKQKSRTMCSYCVIEELHKNCKQTLLFKNNRTFQLKQSLKSGAQDVKHIYEYLQTEKQIALEKLEEVYGNKKLIRRELAQITERGKNKNM